jgi:hypothetical protein
MRCLVLLLLLLAAVPVHADDLSHRDAMRSDPEHAINFATLPAEQARCLRGQRCVFRIEVSKVLLYEGFMWCDCTSGIPGSQRIALLPLTSPAKAGAVLFVKGRLEITTDKGEAPGLYINARRRR